MTTGVCVHELRFCASLIAPFSAEFVGHLVDASSHRDPIFALL
jgi:hypothetical protein